MWTWLRVAVSRVAAMFSDRRLDSDFDSELRGHLDLLVNEHVRRGASVDDSRRLAHLTLGNITALKEEQRISRRLPVMGEAARDLRHAARLLRRNPGFTAVAVFTLTVGVGANAAVFTVVDSVLLRPLPYDESERLVKITGLGSVVAGRPVNLSRPDFADLARETRTLDSLGAYDSAIGSVTLVGSGEAERVRAVQVSAGFFQTLGASPELGRLTRQDDDDQPTNVMVLSHGFWQRRFGGDPAAIGRTVALGQGSFLIIGVLPPTFRYPQPEVVGDPDIYRPMPFNPPSPRSSRTIRAVGRVKSGLTVDVAQADLGQIASELARRYPREDYRTGVTVVPLINAIVGDSRAALWLCLASVLCVLVIACVNLTSLSLARSLARQGELAIRAALGASRGRLLRQVVTEGLLLGAIGGLSALVVAAGLLHAVLAVGRDSLPRISDIHLNARALGASLMLALVAGVLASAMPAVRGSRATIQTSLRQEGRTNSGLPRRRVRHALIVAEVALATMLLIGAGLLARSLWKLTHVDPGFTAGGTLTAQVSLPSSRYGPDTWPRFYDELYARVQRLPGVIGVAGTSILPLSGSHSCDALRIDAHPVPEGQEPCAETRSVSHTYFTAMGIRILRGRGFDVADQEHSQPVIVINQAMAERFWPGEDPLGKTVTLTSLGPAERPRQIVGIVGNTAHRSLSEPAVAQYYIPQHQPPLYPGITLVVRSTGSPGALAPVVREQLLDMDPQLPLYNARTFDELLASSTARPRFQTLLSGAFALLALALALGGVHGVLAHSIGQRVREIGIRMCLGAERRDVVRLLLRQAMTPVLAGTLIGLVGAAGLARWLGTLLYGIAPIDLATFVGAPLLLGAAALVAAYLPVRRATRIAPAMTLRGD